MKSAPAETEAPAVTPVIEDAELYPHEYTVQISELMAKNRASLRDADGDFSDWIELENYGSENVSLKGLYLSDKQGGTGWALPGTILRPGERLLVFASGKDRAASELHTDFSLSDNEHAFLKNSYGEIISELSCELTEADCSIIPVPDGEKLCLYPTPGDENTIEAYIARQEMLSVSSPLVINEVKVYTPTPYMTEKVYDWVELKNLSSDVIELSDYTLSDKLDEPQKMPLPQTVLYPGEVTLVYCSEDSFEFSSDYDRLFLFDKSAALCDYAVLHDIPYEGSIGRLDGENGFFYFTSPTPGSDNYDGCRYVAERPAALSEDGVFNDVESVKLELSADGTIYYTLDGTMPTEYSDVYTAPIEITQTTAVRAINVVPGAIASRAASFNFIINENHTLPVACLNVDNYPNFRTTYLEGWKAYEYTGNLSFYEDSGSFSANCNIKLNGETSLALVKKNLSTTYRGAYGDGELEYDLYGGGATKFKNLLLRAGQDYYNTIVRNELAQELAFEFTDNIINQRSRFCVLYVNANYYGVYTIKEKCNEALYAGILGVDEDDVTVYEANVSADTDLCRDVLGYAADNDMSDPQCYAELCSHLDIDSLIDWLIVQGLSANNDLASGNLRYCIYNAPGEKWKLMFYDLDATFAVPDFIMRNVLSDARLNQQITQLARNLMANEEFCDKLLTRTGEALNTVYTNEHIIEKMYELAAEIDAEVERETPIYGRQKASWLSNLESFEQLITTTDWKEYAIYNMVGIFKLTDEEVEHYFR